MSYRITDLPGAHRVVYELLIDPIPDHLQSDHLCRIRACVNPEHIEPVTLQENLRRSEAPSAQNARKTHCPKNHPLWGSNLYVAPSGRRECRACRKLRTPDRVRANRERRNRD